MKNVIFLLSMLSLLSGISFAQFEGAIDMKVSMIENGKSHDAIYTMLVKNNLMATSIKSDSSEGGHGKFIFRGDKQALWVVDEAEKSYLEISLKDENKSNTKKVLVITKPQKAKQKIKNTGKKETILGYTCDELVIEDNDEVTHIWGTSKLGNVYHEMLKSFGEVGGQEAAKGKKGWEDELVDMKLFPLKIISMKDGKVEQTQEVTRIEKKTIPASTFEVPKDYKKQSIDFDMEKMMKEMQEQNKNEKEIDENNPGKNEDYEKMMKQMQEMIKGDKDTSDGSR